MSGPREELEYSDYSVSRVGRTDTGTRIFVCMVSLRGVL